MAHDFGLNSSLEYRNLRARVSITAKQQDMDALIALWNETCMKGQEL